MTGYRFAQLHHAAFTHPTGAEDEARRFYVGVLGLSEVTKPSTMNRSRGAWFRSPDGGVEIHAIPDPDFHPNSLGHPAIVVDDLDLLARHLKEHGARVEPDSRFPGYRRFHTYDGFGNQIEFMEAIR